MTKKRNTLRAPPAKADAAGPYIAEIRFGVVMYGGVSLAVYINGVAQELFLMASATPRAGFELPREEPGTRDIYERLAVLAGNQNLQIEYAGRIGERDKNSASDECRKDVWDDAWNNGYPRTRFAVDVISGTSAGGINGIFLAAALANGRKFDALKDLWIEEGDFSLLLNDVQSFKGLAKHLRPGGTPRSLLNSDRMYVKLQAALERMGPLTPNAPIGSAGDSPLAEQVDLYVTTTDVAGAPVALRLFDKVVHEKRYRQSFHFSYPTGLTCNGNDFAPANNPFLAFAARCTSSFPFAFEPMTLGALSRLQPSLTKAQLERWQGFFSTLPSDEFKQPFNLEERAFGDGGYLDNAPFSYVVDTLARRAGNIQLERKLLYIEPSPKLVDPRQPASPPPDALSNSIAALIRIPQYESIREDLENVLQRNRRIERVEWIVRQSEASLERRTKLFAKLCTESGECRDWASLTFSKAADIYGDAFLPYLRLRTAAVTDSIAERLGVRWNIDPATDQQYALRALVRVWRERHYNDEGTDGHSNTNAFLDEFDVDYRVRQLGFVLRKIDQLTRLSYLREIRAKPTLSDSDKSLMARLKAYLPGADRLTAEQLNAARLALQALKTGLVEVRTRLLTAQYVLARCGAGASPVTTRRELCGVLKLLLGEQPDPNDPIALMLAGGGSSVPINSKQLNDASSGLRTLQERTFERAKAIYEMASKNGRTELQEALEGHIESMRMLAATAEPGANTSLGGIAKQAWVLLGKPRAAACAQGTPAPAVPVSVEKADSAAFGVNGKHERILALDSDVGTAIRQLLSEYYLAYDEYDQISFPLYYDTDTGEPAKVEVARVSPLDATNLIDENEQPNSKLAGTAYGHFGAFLDRRWRRNDVMWGRLDGAERLIQVLLPGTDRNSVNVRKELIEIAQGRILHKELVEGGHYELSSLICNALQESNGGDPDPQVRRMLTQLKLGGATARDSMHRLLTSLLSEKALLDFVRHARRVDPVPDPEATVKSVARAVSITGRILDGISKQHGKNTALPRWLARLGLFLQGIVAVSFPGALKQRWWSHGVKILYAFEVAAFAFSLLLGGGAAAQVAVTAFGVTAFAHLLTMVVGDLMAGRHGKSRVIAVLAVLAVIILAGIGVAAIVRAFSSPAAPPPCDACLPCRPPCPPPGIP